MINDLFGFCVAQTHLVFAWDYATRTQLPFSPLRLKNHVYCISFSPDGKYVAFGHEEGKVQAKSNHFKFLPVFDLLDGVELCW